MQGQALKIVFLLLKKGVRKGRIKRIRTSGVLMDSIGLRDFACRKDAMMSLMRL
jgi:hypothetical protein